MAVNQGVRGGAALAVQVRLLYAQGQSDYGLEPLVLVDEHGHPIGRIEDGDAVIFCCRRGEREIQLTEAFTDPVLDCFPRRAYNRLDFVILTLYHEKFKDLPVAFAPAKIEQTLGEVVSLANLRQLRVAESEKYAHVTFFFNGGDNQPFPGEVDVRIPSPKGLPYEQTPEMSLAPVADRVITGLQEGYDLVVTNFANGDVIGHTANRQAKIECAEHIDAHLGRVLEAARANDTIAIITADHGNLEVLYHPDGSPHVAHTANPVPFIVLDPRAAAPLLPRDGKLADLAPTLLRALGVPQPAVMQGTDLLPGHDWGGRRRLLLVILDGWGIGSQDENNPIVLAHTPVWDSLVGEYPGSRLAASGQAVGLQAGKAGNSEAGHMNIGAGRVVLQDDVRLDLAMQDGTFQSNEIFCQVMQSVQQRHASLHLICLLSEKSSHGSIDYPLELLRMARPAGLQHVYVHVIFDGRSTEPGSAPALLELLDSKMQAIGVGQIVTGIGRGIALDRDGNYEKTRRAYEALVYGTGRKCPADGGE